MNYRKHWGLRESPFRGGLDPRLFYPSPTHDEALARLEYLADDHRRVGLLLGDAGTGKSLVLEVFARRLRRAGAQVANLNLLGIDLHEFLWLAAAELGVNPDRGDREFVLWRGLLDRLAENRYQQLDTVLLLDDADEAPAEVLDHIARLANCEQFPAARLTIVMAAPPARAHLLGSRLLDLAALRIDIDPWEEADTGAYVTAALKHSGRSAPVFTEAALARLHELTGGVPRRVNQLANMALVAGAGRELTMIDADIVDSVYRELGVAAVA